MKKFYVLTIFTSLIIAILASFAFQRYVLAQSETTSFPGLVPFGLAAGRFGFFDRTTGKIFIYNDNATDCIFIGKLKELGKPIEKEHSDTSIDSIQNDRYNKNLLKYKKDKTTNY